MIEQSMEMLVSQSLGRKNSQYTEEQESRGESTDSNFPFVKDFSSLTTGFIRRRTEAKAAKTRIQHAVKELKLRKRRSRT